MFAYALGPVSQSEITGYSLSRDGASAYEIAVANGFIGTEVEWLASLVGGVGPAGATGPAGVAGPVGPRGLQGDRGLTGSQGVQGVAGPAGAAGSRGETGPAGVRGPKGDTGIQGDVGPAGVAGPTGLTGAQGIAGPQGVRGERGERGETGQRGDHFTTSSVTPLAISSGNVSLTVDTGLSYTPAQHVVIGRDANKFMLGYVASYDAETGALSVDVYQTSGSGSYTEWFVNQESRGTPGDSAYEVALANGFAGPESAWLASLVGPQGPAGVSGNGAYVHTQIESSAVWQISHNLGFFPNVTVQDEDEYDVIGALSYVDENTVNVTFSSSITGVAYLS